MKFKLNALCAAVAVSVAAPAVVHANSSLNKLMNNSSNVMVCNRSVVQCVQLLTINLSPSMFQPLAPCVLLVSGSRIAAYLSCNKQRIIWRALVYLRVAAVRCSW